ncbi:MAG: bifunctional aldolase/short-chain dehydrogenase, partial [Candidatus Thiodiazotropha lotti]
MKSQWNPTEAAACENELSLRVYTSRLLGSDPTLVLHGGGNTSVKIVEPDLFGEDQQILYVKGSGWDLASIEAPGFT